MSHDELFMSHHVFWNLHPHEGDNQKRADKKRGWVSPTNKLPWLKRWNHQGELGVSVGCVEMIFTNLICLPQWLDGKSPDGRKIVGRQPFFTPANPFLWDLTGWNTQNVDPDGTNCSTSRFCVVFFVAAECLLLEKRSCSGRKITILPTSRAFHV